MFRITMGKGFQITFKNGVTLSVQWGPGNYCENHSEPTMAFFNTKAMEIDLKSENAEIAIWDKDGVWITKEWNPELNDDVKGHVMPDEIPAIMLWCQSR